MLSDLRQKVYQLPGGITLSVGLCWEFIGVNPVDLDLSAVCFTRDSQFYDVAFFNHLLPKGIDEEELKAMHHVDPARLPYMFLSGDSRIGGEEENRMAVNATTRQRRKDLFGHHTGKRSAALTMANLFSRLYAEEELHDVQEAIDYLNVHGGDAYNENGQLVHYTAKRELCDEVLTFVLDKIPTDVGVIFITVTSYNGQDIGTLGKTKLVITNETTGQRVGIIDLHNISGNATANLAAMFIRVPPELINDASPLTRETLSGCWDLRELNIHTFGYTFVDILPLMQDVMNIPQNSRMDALQKLPDYSLEKNYAQLLSEPLLNLRFGVGWDGEHDLDAFLVMLDETHTYVDHVYPKQGKLHSIISNLARHSGDALSGADIVGDAEFIDLRVPLLPSNVQTIFIGVSYSHSHHLKPHHVRSIYDIPKLYLRLQNRTWRRPHSFEVDRWEVHQPRVVASGEAARVLLLGVLVKTSSIAREGVLPPPTNQPAPDDLEPARLPALTYLAVHQPIPVDPGEAFDGVIPFLQWVAAFLEKSGCIPRRQPFPGPASPSRGGSAQPTPSNAHEGRREDLMEGLVGWDHVIVDFAAERTALGPKTALAWEAIQRNEQLAKQFAVEIKFLEVLALEPRVPDRFRCHIEAWVHGQGANSLNGVYKSAFLGNPENLSWGPDSKAAVFIVHKYDRIRVLLYEHAVFGYANVDLLRLPGLWQTKGENAIELNLSLTSANNPLFKGEIRLRMRQVPRGSAYLQLRKRWKRLMERKSAHHVDIQQRAYEKYNQDFNLCSIM